jgi:hypothetical protein
VQKNYRPPTRRGRTIPHYGDKYDADALFSPSDAVEAQGDGLPAVPPAVVLGYQVELTDAVRERSDDGRPRHPGIATLY